MIKGSNIAYQQQCALTCTLVAVGAVFVNVVAPDTGFRSVALADFFTISAESRKCPALRLRVVVDVPFGGARVPIGGSSHRGRSHVLSLSTPSGTVFGTEEHLLDTVWKTDGPACRAGKGNTEFAVETNNFRVYITCVVDGTIGVNNREHKCC